MIRLEQGEEIVREVPRHWFVLYRRVIILPFLVIIPFLVYAAITWGGIGAVVHIDGSTGAIFAAIVAMWTLYIWIAFFVIWTNYHLDVLVITTEKAIDVDQKALFYRDISTCRLDRIQDVTVVVRGIIPSLLKFGTITIQTAGEEDNFVIHGVPHPYDVKEMIMAESHRAVESWRQPAQSATPVSVPPNV